LNNIFNHGFKTPDHQELRIPAEYMHQDQDENQRARIVQ